MRTEESNFSTICGPRTAVLSILENWDALAAPRRFGLHRAPRLIDLSALDAELSTQFSDSRSPAIAVIEHHAGIATLFSRQLHVELMVGGLTNQAISTVVCEPGYLFHGAGTPAGNHRFAAGKLAQIAQSVPSNCSKASGCRVAMLDSGLDPTAGPNGNSWDSQMVDFTDSISKGVRGPIAADDLHGHGTAMAQVVTTVHANAEINAIRVLDQNNSARSYEVLAGLQYALFSDKFDCVLAALTTFVTTSCDVSLGQSVEWMLAYRQNRTPPPPAVVAAAGNGGNGNPSGYPALIPSAVVAIAIDATGKPETYNSDPPAYAQTAEAYGGSTNDPVGDVTHPDGSISGIWGTSIAAAAIAGACLT